MINESVTKEIRSHAEQEFPKEACGLVIVERGKLRYVPCTNASTDPLDHFIIPAEEFADAEDRGEVVGVVHSHPNYPARPSPGDMAECEKSELPWHIVHVSVPDGEAAPVAGEIYSFEPSGFEAPLIGRQFCHGVLDCYALVRDFYAREWGVHLEDYKREMGWWDEGKDYYLDRLVECGFSQFKGEPKYGDLILMQVRAPTVNHAGIYLGDGTMMHHMIHRLSTRDVYGGYWAEVTRMIVRHEKSPYA